MLIEFLSCKTGSLASTEVQSGVTLLGPIMHKGKSAGRFLGRLLLPKKKKTR